VRVTAGMLVEPLTGKLLTIFTDAAATSPASIAAYDPQAPSTPGAVLDGSNVRVAGDSRVPLFWFPDGVDVVWAKTRDDYVFRLVADVDARLDAAPGTYLPKADPEVVDSTLKVRKGDNSAALQVRTTGSAVDVEKGNGDIVVSTWSGALPGAGSQTALQRWRADGNTLVGVTEFGTTAYDSPMSVDTTTGRAKLGSRNSLNPISFCGWKATSGAPTTGIWAAGDAVLDSVGAWHLCTAGGTPGTWT
jgi:hypothetical protein